MSRGVKRAAGFLDQIGKEGQIHGLKIADMADIRDDGAFQAEKFLLKLSDENGCRPGGVLDNDFSPACRMVTGVFVPGWFG